MEDESLPALVRIPEYAQEPLNTLINLPDDDKKLLLHVLVDYMIVQSFFELKTSIKALNIIEDKNIDAMVGVIINLLTTYLALKSLPINTFVSNIFNSLNAEDFPKEKFDSMLNFFSGLISSKRGLFLLVKSQAISIDHKNIFESAGIFVDLRAVTTTENELFSFIPTFTLKIQYNGELSDKEIYFSLYRNDLKELEILIKNNLAAMDNILKNEDKVSFIQPSQFMRGLPR